MKRIPHEEAVTAADKVGADFRWLDLGDYLLSMTDVTVEQLVSIFQGVKPNIVLTYNPADPFNPDHPVACQMVQKARLLSSGAGVASTFSRIALPDLYFFEHHQPELCDFKNHHELFKVGYESMKNEM